MRNEEWLATAHLRPRSNHGTITTIIADQVEGNPPKLFTQRPRAVHTYACPSCTKPTRFNIGRIIRGPDGTRIKICPKCYKLGPAIVLNAIGKNSNGKETSGEPG